MRRGPRAPTWKLQISSLWYFPAIALGLMLPIAAGMGQRGGLPAPVIVGLSVGLYAYPPYLLGSSVSLLIPARVAPVLSAETQARTLEALRLTNLSSVEIVLGKMFAALGPFFGLFKYLVNLFVLLVILGGLGASALPRLLGIPPIDIWAAIILLVLPGILGPIANIWFVIALSVAVSAHTSRPNASIGITYGILLVYWVLTSLALVAILLLLSRTFGPGAFLMQAYAGNRLALALPNVLRLVLAIALTPILIQAAIRRIELG